MATETRRAAIRSAWADRRWITERMMAVPVAVVTAARLVVGLMLMWSTLGKLRDPDAFIAGIHDYRLLRPRAERTVGALVPPVELLIATLLLVGVALPWAGFAAAALFALFGVAIASAVARHLDIPCHCGTVSALDRVGVGTILRSVALVLLALVAGRAPEMPTIAGVLATLQLPDGWAELANLAILMTLVVWLAEAVPTVIGGVWRARRQGPKLREAEDRRVRRARDVAAAAGGKQP